MKCSKCHNDVKNHVHGICIKCLMKLINEKMAKKSTCDKLKRPITEENTEWEEKRHQKWLRKKQV